MQDFLKERKLKLLEKISKGCSSEIFLVQNSNGEKFALKAEKAKSRRHFMAQKEASSLKLANSIGIGPKLFDFDFEKGIILMEFIEGKTFNKFIFDGIPKKEDLEKVLESLLLQAKKLDEIGLDHGQLAGRGKNILLRENLEPAIIDFEKSSQVRKPHNVDVLNSFFFRKKSAMVKKINSILKRQID